MSRGLGDVYKRQLEQLSYKEQWYLEKRNAICMTCGRVSPLSTQSTFEDLAVDFEGTTASGAERFYRRTLDKLRLKLLESMKRFAAEKAEKETELKKQKETLKKLYQLKETQKEISEKYSLVAHLWEIAQGKETGINLERFVLGALLDAVTEKANLRLMEMSGNRYELLRKRGERSDGRKKAGLDLEVFDANTGRARPAATLSGGETFLASLSLALGLADVVQEYAGGVHLDAMFIDEGFGSLDSESLDLAMKTLQELKGQNRLIGLISHVGGLEERIPAKLRVTKTQTGSTAAFEVG